MTPEAFVARVSAAHPGDTDGLLALLDSGMLDAQGILAILGKTEGNGCVNDFTRGYATLALRSALTERLGRAPRADLALVMSGGTEGGLSPHLLIFGKRAATAPAGGKRLAIGVAHTPVLQPEDIGRSGQLDATIAAVHAAMRDAGIDTADDVHYVQVKCPLLTMARIEAAQARGRNVATHDTYASMGLSRGASALGVAVALGELPRGRIADADICHDWSLYTGRAATSAGVELMHNEIMVLGNSPRWGGTLAIAHRVMGDAIDAPAVWGALADLGIEARGQVDDAARERIVAVLAKAEASSSGRIRGARHIMWDDSDIHATRHARALVGGVIAGVIGGTQLFVSGGAEHQGPDGGGPVAVIARV